MPQGHEHKIRPQRGICIEPSPAYASKVDPEQHRNQKCTSAHPPRAQPPTLPRVPFMAIASAAGGRWPGRRRRPAIQATSGYTPMWNSKRPAARGAAYSARGIPIPLPHVGTSASRPRTRSWGLVSVNSRAAAGPFINTRGCRTGNQETDMREHRLSIAGTATCTQGPGAGALARRPKPFPGPGRG